MSNICLSCQPAGRPVILRGRQTSKPILFIPAILIGAIDFYHFIWPSLTLTLPGGHKISTEENLLASFSPTFFM